MTSVTLAAAVTRLRHGGDYASGAEQFAAYQKAQTTFLGMARQELADTGA